VNLFSDEYLRSPTEEDLARLLHSGAERFSKCRPRDALVTWAAPRPLQTTPGRNLGHPSKGRMWGRPRAASVPGSPAWRGLHVHRASASQCPQWGAPVVKRYVMPMGRVYGRRLRDALAGDTMRAPTGPPLADLSQLRSCMRHKTALTTSPSHLTRPCSSRCQVGFQCGGTQCTIFFLLKNNLSKKKFHQSGT